MGRRFDPVWAYFCFQLLDTRTRKNYFLTMLSSSSTQSSELRQITGHKCVRDALRDTSTYSSDLQGDADVRDYRQIPLEVDPPRHHAYRSALAPFFVKPVIEKLIPEFTINADQLITQFFNQPTEVVSDLALPLVMKNLGIIYRRDKDVEEWISWGSDVWRAAGGERNGTIFHQHLDVIYEDAINSKSDDLWSEIIALEIEGKKLSRNEFIGIASVLLAGGRDTLIKLMTGIIWYFGHHPVALNYLRENRNFVDQAVQEFLRFFTPLPSMARNYLGENETGSAIEKVSVSFISANFDETVFENPLQISLTRERIPHLSFGFGPHTCLGNHVAEIETKVFLNSLLDSNFSWQISDKCKIEYFEGELSIVPKEFNAVFLSAL